MFERITFEDGETITLIVRKHWFILFSQTIGLVIMFVLPFILLLVLQASSEAERLFDMVPMLNVGALLIFVASAWALVVWIALFSVWTNYYLDSWTLTSRRIIVVDQRGLFHRTVSSFRLERLQDVHIEIDGFIATFLDFGTIRAQTAGHEDTFVMKGAPGPQDLKGAILSGADALMKQVSNQN